MVVWQMLCPRYFSCPLIRREPQVLFLRAIWMMSCSTSSEILFLPGFPLLAAIVLPGDQSPAAIRQCVRGKDSTRIGQDRPSQPFRQPGQSHPLVVIEEDSLGAEFLPQDLVLLLEVRNHVLLMPVHPSRQHHQEHAHRFHFHHDSSTFEPSIQRIEWGYYSCNGRSYRLFSQAPPSCMLPA